MKNKKNEKNKINKTPSKRGVEEQFDQEEGEHTNTSLLRSLPMLQHAPRGGGHGDMSSPCDNSQR